MDRAMEIAAQFVGLTSFPISLAYVLVCIAGCLVLREPPKTNALSSGDLDEDLMLPPFSTMAAFLITPLLPPPPSSRPGPTKGNKTASRQNMTVGTRLMVAFNIGLTAVNLIMVGFLRELPPPL